MSKAREELELAEEAWNDYRHMDEISLRRRYSTLYYTAYHSVSAMLLKKDYSTKTHSGTDALVRNILFKDQEVLDKTQVQAYSKLKTRREQADYDSEFYGSENEIKELEEKVEQILQVAQRRV